MKLPSNMAAPGIEPESRGKDKTLVMDGHTDEQTVGQKSKFYPSIPPHYVVGGIKICQMEENFQGCILIYCINHKFIFEYYDLHNINSPKKMSTSIDWKATP